jgi:iron complex transport system substrate-binding protein
MVGRADRAEQLASQLRAGLDRIREQSRELPRRPRVYFEEWNDPLISGIEWVEELVEIAGGAPTFRNCGMPGSRRIAS